MWKRLLLLLLLALAAVGGVCAYRAAQLVSRQLPVEEIELLALDTDAEAARLAGAIRFRSISYEDPSQFPADEFRRLNAYLEEQFPTVHRRLTREAINEHSAIYTWIGTDPQLAPVLLMAHLDVVPIVPGTEKRWLYPPFEGMVADGYIWGRGTMDDKMSAVAILAAVERLLELNYTPRRTVMIAFGHDEEIGGPNGAQQIAKTLESRGVKAEMVLDEGGAIVQGALPGLTRPIATVGIAEKGSMSLRLTVRSEGGHSSTPPDHTAIGILSTAIDRLERYQMPKGRRGAAGSFLAYVGPELPFSYRLATANLWLFEPLLAVAMGDSPAINATLRTTTAVTMIRGGVKANVLPTDAEAIVNFRTLPGDTDEVVIEHVRRTVDDERIEVAVYEKARDASPISPDDSESFQLLHRTIRQLFPEVIVAPFLTLGGTDSRYFTGVSPNVYRFLPLVADQEDLARVHGINERVAVDNYIRAIQFYAQLFRQM